MGMWHLDIMVFTSSWAVMSSGGINLNHPVTHATHHRAPGGAGGTGRLTKPGAPLTEGQAEGSPLGCPPATVLVPILHLTRDNVGPVELYNDRPAQLGSASFAFIPSCSLALASSFSEQTLQKHQQPCGRAGSFICAFLSLKFLRCKRLRGGMCTGTEPARLYTHIWLHHTRARPWRPVFLKGRDYFCSPCKPQSTGFFYKVAKDVGRSVREQTAPSPDPEQSSNRQETQAYLEWRAAF